MIRCSKCREYRDNSNYDLKKITEGKVRPVCRECRKREHEERKMALANA